MLIRKRGKQADINMIIKTEEFWEKVVVRSVTEWYLDKTNH